MGASQFKIFSKMKKIVFLFSLLFAFSFVGMTQTEYLVSKDRKTVVKAVDTTKYTFDHYVFNDSLFPNENIKVVEAGGKEVDFKFNFKQYDGFYRKYKLNKTAWLDTETKQVKMKTSPQKDLFAWEIIVFFLLTFMSALMLTVYKKKTSTILYYKLGFAALIFLFIYIETQNESKTIILEHLAPIELFTLISVIISLFVAEMVDMGDSVGEDYLPATAIFHTLIGITLVWISIRYWAWALAFSAYPIVFIIKENWIGKLWKKIFSKKEKKLTDEEKEGINEKIEKTATE